MHDKTLRVNQSFLRVYLAGNPVICNGQPWAYVNMSDANYSAITAGILAAKASGGVSTIYGTQDSQGYCQLTWFTVS